MSEEEKQAIDRTKRILYMLPEPNDFKIIINLAERQQKEIIDLKERLEIAKVMKNKQQKEIEELITERDKKQEENIQLKVISQQNFVNAFMDSNYISKDKIKEKIKELEDNEKFEIEQYGFDYVENINLAVNILKELLGEENK